MVRPYCGIGLSVSTSRTAAASVNWYQCTMQPKSTLLIATDHVDSCQLLNDANDIPPCMGNHVSC